MSNLGIHSQPKEPPSKEEFEELVDRLPWSGCWIWRRAVTDGRNSYGLFKRMGKKYKAHRYAYELYKGPVPKTLLVCHKCDIPSCVNPDHLFVGTYADNAKDCASKGRTAKPKIKEDFAEKMRAVAYRTWQTRKGLSLDIVL